MGDSGGSWFDMDMMSFLTCSASPEDGASFLTCSYGPDDAEATRPGEFDGIPAPPPDYGWSPVERAADGSEGGVESIRYDDRDPDVAGDALSDDEGGGGRRGAAPPPLSLDFAAALPRSAMECRECVKAFRKDRIMGQMAALIPLGTKADVDALLSRVTCGLREYGRACLCDRTDAKKRSILWHAVNCNDAIAVRVFLTAGAGASLSRRREDPRTDPISLALERGHESIAEALLADLHPAPAVGGRGGGRAAPGVTVIDARDDHYSDTFWCCSTNPGFAYGSEARMRARERAPYDFAPPPPPAETLEKKRRSLVQGFSPVKKTTTR